MLTSNALCRLSNDVEKLAAQQGQLECHPELFRGALFGPVPPSIFLAVIVTPAQVHALPPGHTMNQQRPDLSGLKVIKARLPLPRCQTLSIPAVFVGCPVQPTKRYRLTAKLWAF